MLISSKQRRMDSPLGADVEIHENGPVHVGSIFGTFTEFITSATDAAVIGISPVKGAVIVSVVNFFGSPRIVLDSCITVKIQLIVFRSRAMISFLTVIGSNDGRLVLLHRDIPNGRVSSWPARVRVILNRMSLKARAVKMSPRDSRQR